MVKYYDLSRRNRAIGMIQAGMSQSHVAKNVSVPLRTVQRWWKHFKTHGTVAPLWASDQLVNGGQARDEEGGRKKESIGDQTCTTVDSLRSSSLRQVYQTFLEKWVEKDGSKRLQNTNEAKVNRNTGI